MEKMSIPMVNNCYLCVNDERAYEVYCYIGHTWSFA